MSLLTALADVYGGYKKGQVERQAQQTAQDEEKARLAEQARESDVATKTRQRELELQQKQYDVTSATRQRELELQQKQYDVTSAAAKAQLSGLGYDVTGNPLSPLPLPPELQQAPPPKLDPKMTPEQQQQAYVAWGNAEFIRLQRLAQYAYLHQRPDVIADAQTRSANLTAQLNQLGTAAYSTARIGVALTQEDLNKAHAALFRSQVPKVANDYRVAMARIASQDKIAAGRMQQAHDDALLKAGSVTQTNEAREWIAYNAGLIALKTHDATNATNLAIAQYRGYVSQFDSSLANAAKNGQVPGTFSPPGMTPTTTLPPLQPPGQTINYFGGGGGNGGQQPLTVGSIVPDGRGGLAAVVAKPGGGFMLQSVDTSALAPAGPTPVTPEQYGKSLDYDVAAVKSAPANAVAGVLATKIHDYQNPQLGLTQQQRANAIAKLKAAAIPQKKIAPIPPKPIDWAAARRGVNAPTPPALGAKYGTRLQPQPTQ